jgi:hypothetical protein
MPVNLEVEGLDSFGDGTGTLEVLEFRHVEWTTGEFRDGSFGTSSPRTCPRLGAQPV